VAPFKTLFLDLPDREGGAVSEPYTGDAEYRRIYACPRAAGRELAGSRGRGSAL